MASTLGPDEHPRLTTAALGDRRWVKSSTGWREWVDCDWRPSAPPPSDALFGHYLNT